VGWETIQTEKRGGERRLRIPPCLHRC